jgi:pimeloyl-ACP methyl ester carboxylesterase
VRVADPENDPIQFKLKNAPAGMIMSSDTGEISWIPASSQGGEHQVEVVVSDGHEADLQDFVIKVQTTKVATSARIIAADGGVLEVTDPISPVFGSKIEIDAGVLPQDSTITISSASFPSYLPNRVPVLEIKSDLPPVATQKATSNLQGLRSASIPGRTTVIMPFPLDLTTTEEESLKLYMSRDIVFCRNTNIRRPSTNPFYCPHGEEFKAVWEALDPTEYVKDRVARIFFYSLPAGTEADVLRSGNVLSISAMTPPDQSSHQRRFVEIINPASSIGKSGNLILVHGVCSDSGQFRARDGLIDFVQNDGRSPYVNVFFYNYPWNEPIRYNGNELKRAMEELSQSGVISVDGTFDIIAHSMGGVVARWAIEDQDGGRRLLPGVGRLFMLASPNFGVHSWHRNRNIPFCSDDWGSPEEEDTGLDELIEGSIFLTHLNRSDGGGSAQRRGSTAYYWFTGKTRHAADQLVVAGFVPSEHPAERWSDHIHGLGMTTFVDFVPVPTVQESEFLGLRHRSYLGERIPPNTALTFDGVTVGIYNRVYDHSTIHTNCSWNLVCQAIVAALNYSPSTDTSVEETVNLVTTVDGNGSIGGAVECGADVCSHSFSRGTILTIGAIAGDGWVFSGWSGACTGINSCLVTMDSEKSVTATFVMAGPSPDITPPDTIIDSGPLSSDISTSVTFAFHATESDSTFECQFDGGVFEICISPKTYTDVGPGSHSFSVRAIDVAGNTDLTPAGGAWSDGPILPAQVTLVVDIVGDGNVTGGAIQCSTRDLGTCSTAMVGGTSIVLLATPSAGSVFLNWSGACTGTWECRLNFDADKSVTAVFAAGVPFINVVSVSGGSHHSLALRGDGTVWAWGEGGSGELGNGLYNDSNVPVEVSNLANVIAIAAGGAHSVALKNDGTVWTWGDNELGQLGEGTPKVNTNVPVRVPDLTNISAIAAGGGYSAALTQAGAVLVWGDLTYCYGPSLVSYGNRPTQIASISNIIAIASGCGHLLALHEDGTVWTWGMNLWGELGNGMFNSYSQAPQQIAGFGDVVSIAGGLATSFARRQDGSIWGWGENHWGQLGDGTYSNKINPTPINGLTDIAIIEAGGWGLIALDSHGSPWISGLNYGNIPVKMLGLTDIVSVEGGANHFLAVQRDGTVWTWGGNSDGQLGNGTHVESQFTQVQVLMSAP